MAKGPAPTKQPIVLVVHGAWHTPIPYYPLIHALTVAGFSALCPQLPTCSNKQSSTTSLTADIATIRAAATDLATHGHPIIAIMHSYGGVVGTEALAGLGWTERAAEGKPGGVVSLVYMTSFMIPVGDSLNTAFGGEAPPVVYSLDDGTCIMDDPWLRFYSTDMAKPPLDYADDPKRLETSLAALAMGWSAELPTEPPVSSPLNPSLVPLSADAIMSVVQHFPTVAQNTTIKAAAYASPGMQVTYLICERDMALLPEGQRGMIAQMKAAGVEIVEEICQAGHSPFLSVPGEVAAVVGRAWGRWLDAKEVNGD